MDLSIKLLTSENTTVKELAIWILANFSDEPSKQIDIGKSSILILIDLLQNPETDTILQHTLRCVTNLCSQRANRKVLDAWGGFEPIVTALKSENAEVQIQAIWCLSNMAAKESSELFHKRDDIIEKLLEFVQSGGEIHEQASWRCISNFALLKHPRKIVLNHNTFEILQNWIISEIEVCLENSDKDVSPLLEAMGCLSNLILKEESLMDKISQDVIIYLVKLLGSNFELARCQAMWCLAYISANEKSHSLILNNGVEVIIDLLEEDDDSLKLPAVWVIANLSSNNENLDRIREVDGIHVLVKILFRSKDDIRLVTGKALSYLSKNSKNKNLLKNLFSKLSQLDESVTQDV